MSAARWRHAMNAPVGSLAAAAGAAAPLPRPLRSPETTLRIAPAWWLLLALLLVYPWIATPFFTFQIGAQALVLGVIALSLALLAGYGGMVSLSQMTVAGIAGYTLAIVGAAAATASSLNLGWPWWLAVPIAIAIATLAATAIGLLAVRTEGIYTIMITLAVGVAFYYLAQQNYTVFNGFQGVSKVFPPELFGLDWRAPLPFYYLALAVALLAFGGVAYFARTPFGIALQGIRDNPRRMRALGFDVTLHRVAAHALAGFVAAVGGVLWVWYHGRISPGTIGTGAMINVLIVAVLGGLRRPLGAFIGALVFVLLQNFAIDLVDRERFNLVIGGVFLAIVLFSPDGLLGLWQRLTSAVRSTPPRRQP